MKWTAAANNALVCATGFDNEAIHCQNQEIDAWGVFALYEECALQSCVAGTCSSMKQISRDHD